MGVHAHSQIWLVRVLSSCADRHVAKIPHMKTRAELLMYKGCNSDVNCCSEFSDLNLCLFLVVVVDSLYLFSYIYYSPVTSPVTQVHPQYQGEQERHVWNSGEWLLAR